MSLWTRFTGCEKTTGNDWKLDKTAEFWEELSSQHFFELSGRIAFVPQLWFWGCITIDQHKLRNEISFQFNHCNNENRLLTKQIFSLKMSELMLTSTNDIDHGMYFETVPLPRQ